MTTKTKYRTGRKFLLAEDSWNYTKQVSSRVNAINWPNTAEYEELPTGVNIKIGYKYNFNDIEEPIIMNIVNPWIIYVGSISNNLLRIWIPFIKLEEVFNGVKGDTSYLEKKVKKQLKATIEVFRKV
jgi:hypothetical protein